MDSDKVFAAWGLPSDFLARHWRRAHAVGQVTESGAPGMLTLADVNDLLGRGLRADRVSISTAGRMHHPAEFTSARTLAGQPVADVVDEDKVRQLLQAGATAVLANAEHWVPKATELSRVLLSENFGCEVQAHVFLTGAGHSGLVPHTDGEDNFLIQVDGRKTWSVWAQEGTAPSRVDMDSLGEPTAVITLTSGDVLYIPVGWVHVGTAGDKGSTHITYQIVPESLTDAVLDQLGDELAELLGDRLLPAPNVLPLAKEAAADLAQRIAELVRSTVDPE
ncbi:JmjC domain-containing protein [Nocardia sp. NPDC049149]|uniref:JmjC domain-containing protein n=1 Tax=Nocardia sp. NPDC049149 TaxID=3364315 RepID=UPI003719F4A8